MRLKLKRRLHRTVWQSDGKLTPSTLPSLGSVSSVGLLGCHYSMSIGTVSKVTKSPFHVTRNIGTKEAQGVFLVRNDEFVWLFAAFEGTHMETVTGMLHLRVHMLSKNDPMPAP